MTPLLFVAVAIAGGLGATGRLVLDGVIRARCSSEMPCGTVIINLSGSLVLGFVTGLTTTLLAPAGWQSIIATGFLGGYTTFSTASFETIRLLQERRSAIGLLSGLGALVVATCLAALGMWLGSSL